MTALLTALPSGILAALTALPQTLAALTWDPQIRGFSIVMVAVLILCGSIYLLLATNTGAKFGLLLAFAGLTGWMFLMGILWMVYGIGLKGDPPAWEVEEIVTGEPPAATAEAVEAFPEGWQRMEPGSALLTEAQATADHVLAAEAQSGGGGHGAEAAAEPEFEPLFEGLDDYVYVGAFRKGGEDSFLPGGLLEHPRGIFHAPHHAVVVVQPTVEQVSLDGAPVTPVADPSAEPITLVMVRDLGSLRFPSFVLTVSMGILFAVSVAALHRRDKELMALRAAPAAG